jgi:membrane-bound lytic murein transglycosylase D
MIRIKNNIKELWEIRQLFFAAMAALLLVTSVVGQEQSGPAPFLPMDTLNKKDSAQLISPGFSDPKSGFKDLFVSGPSANAMNMSQLNPMAIDFVQDYVAKNGKNMESMRTWGKPYFDMMDGILTQHGLPKELKYLAVIESQLKSNVRSWVGAVGPWQFMPVTARNFGLRVNKHYDERTDYFKSTHAASRYLTDLYAIYGDWLLVIAAYNGGTGTVDHAIKKSGSKDFWVLQNFLPAESRNHVKKFIATHYIMENQGGITTSTKDEANAILLNSMSGDKEPAGLQNQAVSGRYNSLVIVKYITMDMAAFNSMNPDFDKQIADNGNYALKLPAEKMDIFNAKKYQILEESVRLLLQSKQNGM